MTWGGLNPALTSFREGINRRFPARGTQSDGGYADQAHGSTSQHQPDADTTVDAFDCDVNLQGSSVPEGTATERALMVALRYDFEDDPRSQLWISRRKIANRDVENWLQRAYGGESPHTKHTHFQSRQSHERDGRPWAFPQTDALLASLRGDDVDAADIEKIAQRVVTLLTPKLDQAVSAWDDAFGRGETRQSAGEALIEIRNTVRTLAAPKEPTDPATE